MERDEENIDRLFNENLSGMEVTPPASAWANIESTLANKKRKRRVFLWRSTIAASVLLFMGLSYYVGLKQGLREAVLYQQRGHIYQTPSDLTQLQDSNISQKKYVEEERETYRKEKKKKPNKQKETITPTVMVREHNNIANNIVEPYSHHTENNKVETKGYEGKSLIKMSEKPEQAMLGLNEKQLKIPSYLVPTEMLPHQNGQKDELAKAVITGAVGKSVYQAQLLGYKPTVGYASSGNIDSDRYASKLNAFQTGASLGYLASNRVEVSVGAYYQNIQGIINDNASQTYEYLVIEEQSDPNNTAIYASVDATSVESYLQGLDQELAEAIETVNNSPDNEEEAISSPIRFNSGYIIQYVEIPLQLRYFPIVKNKLRYFISGGISTALLSNIKKSTYVYNDYFASARNTNQSTVQNFVQNNIIIGTGVDYALGSRVGITIYPHFKYGLISSKHNFFVTSPKLFGVDTGLQFRF